MKSNAKYRGGLPQGDGTLFLTDGGIETCLIFQDGLDLPLFAAFPLLRDARGRQLLVQYYERYIAIARANGTGFILESPTWRASADWGARLGYPVADIAALNAEAIGLMHELRAAHETSATPMVVSGCIGPRGDGYVPGEAMTEGEAEFDAENYVLRVKGEVNRNVELFEKVKVRITDEMEESTGKRKVKLTLV